MRTALLTRGVCVSPRCQSLPTPFGSKKNARGKNEENGFLGVQAIYPSLQGREGSQAWNRREGVAATAPGLGNISH